MNNQNNKQEEIKDKLRALFGKGILTEKEYLKDKEQTAEQIIKESELSTEDKAEVDLSLMTKGKYKRSVNT